MKSIALSAFTKELRLGDHDPKSVWDPKLVLMLHVTPLTPPSPSPLRAHLAPCASACAHTEDSRVAVISPVISPGVLSPWSADLAWAAWVRITWDLVANASF